jgi:hypothetical protein
MPWPVVVPALSADEAKRAAKRLYRFAMGETWNRAVVTTSGNRHTWINHGTFHVNPESWQRMVMDLAWLFFTRANPGARRNPKDINKLEEKLIKEVVKRGWLTNHLKTKEEPPLVREVRMYQANIKRLDSAVVRWENKLKKSIRDVARAKKVWLISRPTTT